MKKCLACKSGERELFCINDNSIFFKKYICIDCLSAVNNQAYAVKFKALQTLCPVANKDLLSVKQHIHEISDSSECSSSTHYRLLVVSGYLLDIIDPYFRRAVSKRRGNSVR